MASENCPHCGAAMLMFSADEDWCPKCKHCIPGSSSNKDRELANLRSQNRDLQQAYDHVLECEQNRCREVVELQDRLAAVTAERDELRRRIDDAPVYLFEDNIRTGPGLLRDDETGKYRTQYKAVTRVRLVRDDQPGEADA